MKLVVLLLLLPHTFAKLFQWEDEHALCSSNIEFVNKTFETASIVRCVPANYAIYFEKLLQAPPSEYHKLIAEKVLSLYSDLRERRNKPMPVTVHREGKEEIVHVYPISFGIPVENIISTIPPKRKPFGSVIPGALSTYYHLFNESDYFKDLQRSLFAVTYKKSGWDCFRHYEILASGTLPLFTDIQWCPAQSMALHPKDLYQVILQQPGLKLEEGRRSSIAVNFTTMAMDTTKLDPILYSATVAALLQYTKNVLSTKAIAQYLIDTAYSNSKGKLSKIPERVFYLTHEYHRSERGDYMIDMLLHGLIQILGESSIIDAPARNSIHKTIRDFNETDYFAHRLRLYGQGFSFGLKIDHLLMDRLPPPSKEEINDCIVNHKYDLIILGSGHRDLSPGSHLDHWDLICKYYDPLEVVFVDGGDPHLTHQILEQYSLCARHIFSREGYKS